MVLLAHIIIALGSIGFSTYTYSWPSLTKIRLNYAAVGLTLVSGAYLV